MLRSLLFGPAALLTFAGACSAADDALRWKELPPLPDAVGFAGSFAGVHNGELLVGGGANFPGAMPWQGGEKVWHDRVFALEKGGKAWKTVGKLPRPLGYGVSLSTNDGVVCIGGSDSQRHYADAFLLRWEGGEVKISLLPSLPKACAQLRACLKSQVSHPAASSDGLRWRNIR